MRKMKRMIVALCVAMALASGPAWAMGASPAAECTLCADDFNQSMEYATQAYNLCMVHTPSPACFTVFALNAAAAEYALMICEAVVLIGG